ncbi:diguanylate cyclase [Campylobacter sp. MIT 19-121]|uniref:GGDEF domain-containing protein n=1 Tax=Campylobacter sp. MIT 19-121 TaxID=2703906 RepID=UPI0013897B4F|nr:diguanylate cyclase [Campylobacter sp. MIT 19-121]NDJ27156.1 diguanylate cyclase [Campylobacter sp. MIT 19-121]
MEDDFLAGFGANFGSSSERETQKIQKISGGEFDKFSKSVLEALVKDNVPPIPTNYRIYFEKMLDSQTMTFKKRITEMMELDSKQEGKQVVIEKKVKKSFSALNILLQDMAMIYKNTEVIKEMIAKRMSELSINSGNLALNATLGAMQIDIDRYLALLSRYTYDIKEKFEEVSHTYKSIEEQSDFDPIFEIYNKKFLLHTLELCKEGYEKYNYQNTIVLFKIKDSVLSKLADTKDKNILLKNIAKIISKNIGKGDILAHYQDGIFVLLLQHCNIQNARKIIEGLIERIYNTNFFISSVEVDMNLEVVMSLIKDDLSIDKLLDKMIKMLNTTGKDSQNFAVLD